MSNSLDCQSSRLRMLTALSYATPETVPSSFMWYNVLNAESLDYLDFIQRQLDLG
jgi:hypothetical protein